VVKINDEYYCGKCNILIREEDSISQFANSNIIFCGKCFNKEYIKRKIEQEINGIKEDDLK